MVIQKAYSGARYIVTDNRPGAPVVWLMTDRRRITHSQGGESIEVYRGLLIKPRVIGTETHYEVHETNEGVGLYPSSGATKAAIDRRLGSEGQA